MANESSDKSEKAAPPKRPTTIDLKATEIKPSSPESDNPEPALANAEPVGEAKPEAALGAGLPPHAAQDADRHGRRVPWGLIAAGIAGALLFLAIGIGAGHWLSRDLQQVSVAPAPVPAPSVPPELLDRLGKLETALAAQRAPDPQLIARIAAAEASVKTAADIAAARERRSDEIAVIAREARERASSAANTADEAAQKARAASPDQSRAELETIAGRLAALENASRANQAELAKRAAVSTDDSRGRLAIAAVALRNAVESGAPFIAELSVVRALSGDAKAIAALEPFAQGGVPTDASLGRELQAAMPSIWKAARADEPVEGSFLERLQANAGKIVRIRPAGEATGDDAPSVKARIEQRAGTADIRGALIELGKLPPDARAPAQAWIKKAEARNAAIAAAQSLAQSALAALAKSGS